MGRGYFNPSIKRIKPSSVAYNNSVKNATKQKPNLAGGHKVSASNKPWDKKHPDRGTHQQP
jgi:hypothetical protein